MINIADKMRELIEHLNVEGIRDVRLHLEPECEEDWSADYAIVHGLWWTAGDFDDQHYFDHAAFRFDLQDLVYNHFSEPDSITIVLIDSEKATQPVGKSCIVVKFYYTSQELEVMRLKA
jgi:hypothetical protein